MAQAKNNTFLYLFFGVIAVLLILILVFVFSGKEKKDSSSLNMEKVELLNNDNSSIDNNLKKQADKEIGKVQVKENINIDMSMLFQKSDLEDTLSKISHETQSQAASNTKTFSQNKVVTTQKAMKTLPVKENVSSPVTVEPVATPSKVRSGFNDTKSQNSASVKTADNNTSTTINVMVNEKQQVKNGSTLRMIATEDFYLDGVKIPKNTIIAGVANMANQRVNISVPSILFNGKLFNVNYTVYDAGDGIAGINVPDLVIHDLAQEEANSTVSSVKINTPVVSVPINTSRKAISDNTATITDKYRLILRTK